MLDNLIVFAATGFALDRAHYMGDHWLQTDHQATHKGAPGREGQIACVKHVASYTVVGALWLGALLVLGLPTHPAQLLAGLGVSAVTHYIADRRTPLRRVATLLGRRPYIEQVTVVRTPGGKPDDCGPGTGLFHLDQSWHYIWIGVAAFVIAL
jgi:hypothetical protein